MIQNLKLLRNRHKISQQVLADVIGVSQQSINKYENHDIEPDIKTLMLIADYFNTSVDFLVGHSDIDCKLERNAPTEFNSEESAFIEKYRCLSLEERRSIENIMDLYIKNK